VLGCYGGQSPGKRLTSLVVNGSIAIDAGSLSEVLEIEEQAEIRSLLLTHSHMDHIHCLPFFVENVFGKNAASIDIYASAETIYAIRKNLFNNAAWPDFSRIPNHLLPALRFREIVDGVPFTVDGVSFTPFGVHHIVPTFGFHVEQDGRSWLWSSDTGPTRRLWEIANTARELSAICLETSFDSSLQRIADLSLHLTSGTLAEELRKLERAAPILLHHLKPRCLDAIQREVRALSNPDINYLEQDRTYQF
jgi:ribonuclease BN (tRNA processing enzyme)